MQPLSNQSTVHSNPSEQSINGVCKFMKIGDIQKLTFLDYPKQYDLKPKQTVLWFEIYTSDRLTGMY